MPRRIRRPISLVLVAALAVSGLSLAPKRALAWGRLGHRAAAMLTESLLTPEARLAVKALLEPGETLADASLWADETRGQHPETGPWHYVNVPISQGRYDDRFCPPGGCVVSKIGDFRRVLEDASAPAETRREALRYLIHFVQDMHQPLHVGGQSDRGGNGAQVRFFGKGSNLHRVWDSGLIERAYRQESELARDLFPLASSPEAAAWGRGAVGDWADESLQAAKDAYRQPEDGSPLRQGARLSEAYQARHLPVAQRRLARAGVRLADLLNDIFKNR